MGEVHYYLNLTCEETGPQEESLIHVQSEPSLKPSNSECRTRTQNHSVFTHFCCRRAEEDGQSLLQGVKCKE